MHRLMFVLALLVADRVDSGCQQASSSGGVERAAVTVEKQASGLTIEQQNVRDRLVADNKPGSIKHLYVISAFSGQVLIYSTVRGKVTSSGKRLTPTMQTGAGQYGESYTTFVAPDGETDRTPEVIQDDGTYGHSVDYIYWWDSKGVYHQHYISGGQIVHISDQPLAVRSVVINMESR